MNIRFSIAALRLAMTAAAAVLCGAVRAEEVANATVVRDFLPQKWQVMPFVVAGPSIGLDPTSGDEEIALEENAPKKGDGTNGFGPAPAMPDPASDQWGEWTYWTGEWWVYDIFNKDSMGGMWNPPESGSFRHAPTAYNNIWLKARKVVPNGWQGGGKIVFEMGKWSLKNCDVVLFINGKRVGAVYRPVGTLDITSFVKEGENEFLMLMTSVGYQVPDPKNPKRGLYKDDAKHHAFRPGNDPPCLIVTPPVAIQDVFANTSWREHKLTVEADLAVLKPAKAALAAEVVDADGKVVKTVRGDFDLKAGSNLVKPSVAWSDPITWELGRGYLYTLRTRVTMGGRTFAAPDVKFGFREVWREGRRIFMNGHEQKFRVSYPFGCNSFGAKFLTLVGYNTVIYPRVTGADPTLSEKDLRYLSENGIGAIKPTAAFDAKRLGTLLKPGEKREAFKRQLAANLKRYRNWPCLVMLYMGANAHHPHEAQEAANLGADGTDDFAKMMGDLVDAAKTTNPNVLFYSHSDGNAAEVASANLFFNWVPMQEREDWPSRWAEQGNLPFQATEFGHPYEMSWYRGGRDLVTELCAIYYGDRAYETEPYSIARNHKSGLWLGRVQHPMTRELQGDFAARVTRAWRTFGVNGGFVWFNHDTGFGRPDWTMEKVTEGYPGGVYDFFKTEEDIPTGRPEWALPYWDIYAKNNQDFLGWIAGSPRITDRRHAYYAGEKVVKRDVMLWDRFDRRTFSSEWKATLGGKEIAKGVHKADLVSNVPDFGEIAFEAPSVKEKTSGTIEAVYRDAAGKEIARDSVAFEVCPRGMENGKLKMENGGVALFDPADEIGGALKELGVGGFRKVASPAEAKGASALVVAPYALKGAKELPLALVKEGLRVLVFSQPTALYQQLGFDVEDVAPRQLFLRDFAAAGYRGLDDGDLRDWYGQPRTDQKEKYGVEPYGHLTDKKDHGPRWNYNMALGGLVLRTPDVVGYLPVVEGEFDGNYSGVLRQRVGKGEIVWTTLSPFGRFGTNELKGAPVRDAAAERTGVAMLADLLGEGGKAASPRPVMPLGAYAKRLAEEVGAVIGGQQADDGKGGVLLAGPDADVSGKELLARAEKGANVLVMGNDRIAKELGLTVETRVSTPSGGVWRVAHDKRNPDLRAIGANLLHFRDFYEYDPLVGGEGWKIDAEGMFAAKTLANGAKIYVTQYETFKLEDKIAQEKECFRRGKIQPVSGRLREDHQRKCDLSFERARQFAARLLTNLGAEGREGATLYRGLTEEIDPYVFNYW